jgi:hypothetical protein
VAIVSADVATSADARGAEREHGDLVATTLAGAIVLGALLLPLWAGLHKIGASQEEGFMLALPDLVLDGKVPNRDFTWLYGPASAWVPAAAYAVFGTDLLVGRIVGFAYELLTVGALFALALRWNRVTATFAGLVTVLFVVTKGLTPLPWTAALPVMLLAVAFGARALLDDARRASRFAFACGAAAGLSTVFRHDVAFGMFAVALIFWFALPGERRGPLVVGAALGLAPWLVHLVTAGPGTVFRGLVLDPLDLRAGNRLPVPPDPDRLNGFMEAFINVGAPPWPFPRPSYAAQLTWWFWLIVAAIVLTIVVAIWSLRRARSVQGWVLLALGAMSVGLVPSMVQRDDAAHLNNLGIVVFPAAICAIAEIVRVRATTPRARLVGAVAGGAGVLLVVGGLTASWTAAAYVDDVAMSIGTRETGAVQVEHRGRRFYFPADAAPAVRQMLRTVEEVAEPGDRLLVGPADLRRTPYVDSVVYHLLPQLEPATRFVYMNPATSLYEDDELADDVASADVLVLSHRWDNWVEPNESVDFGPPTANDVVREQFCRADDAGTDAVFEVYRKCR